MYNNGHKIIRVWKHHISIFEIIHDFLLLKQTQRIISNLELIIEVINTIRHKNKKKQL